MGISGLKQKQEKRNHDWGLKCNYQGKQNKDNLTYALSVHEIRWGEGQGDTTFTNSRHIRY